MYYLKINDNLYGHAGDMIPLMELGLEFLGWLDPIDSMEIWNDKRMVMRFARPHELKEGEEWHWLPALRAVK